MANNKFLVSVADAILRDPNTLAAIAFGNANIDSALTITTQATEVRGGIGNPLLYVYLHDRKVDVKITQATFDKNILALNAGTSVLNGTVSVVATDCLVLSASGSATLTNAPTGNVTAFLENGTVSTVVPVGSVITVGSVSQKITAVYAYNTTADRITVETTTPPSVVDLTLKAEVRDSTGVIVDYLQISIPRFQVNGNYTLAFAANGVSNQALEGSALAVASTDCTTGEYYAKVTWIPASTANISVSDIAATPSSLSFSAGGTLPSSKQITTWGIRGGLSSNVNVTTSASYAITSGCSAVGLFSVGLHTGLVTAGSSTVSGYAGVVTVTYYDATSGSLTDHVNLLAIA
jgi:hypothetical protein